jgi:hypothetical protein
MPEPQFEGLKRRLHAGGVSGRCVERTLAELRDHYADIRQSELGRGVSPAEAAAAARAAIGDERAIAAAILARPELKAWAYRWPRTAGALRSTALIAVMPAVPVIYCAYRGDAIARWGASVGLATLMTGTLLLVLQSLVA